MNTDKLQLLVDNKIYGEEREELLEKIKKDPSLKQELAFLMKIKEMGREKIKTQLKQKNTEVLDPKGSLSEIRAAAFGRTGIEDDVSSLPIKDQTLNSFLDEDEDDK